MQIGNIKIGPGHPPFIIAEMSGNHNQSLEKALAIVDAAAASGAHALKIQTYTADTMTIDLAEGEFFINDPNSLWKGRSLYDLYKEAYTPWEWHKAIFDRAREKGMLAFSSPFDDTSVDFLEGLNVPAYKIASFENCHHPLIRKVARTGKPVIISTGLASFNDIQETVEVLRSEGCKEFALLKCTSSYPASPENTNILTIPDMIRNFKCIVGLSDHTMGLGTAVASIALGANIIEKHFILDRSEGGVDSAFSLNPGEFRQLVEEVNTAYISLGKVSYELSDSEKKSLRFKRSIYAVEDIRQGEAFTEKNVRIIRPGSGLEPKHFDKVLQGKAAVDIKRGTPISWQLVSS